VITSTSPMRALTVLFMATAIFAATACGSSNENSEPAAGSPASTPGPQLSAEEYFDRLKAAFERLEQAVAASANPGGQIRSPEQILPAIQDATTGLEVAIQPFIADVRSLNPSDAIAGAHRDFVAALEKDSDDISALAAEVRAADSLTEATNAFGARKSALVKSRAPCEALQQIAQQEGVSVDLPCEE